MEYIHIEGKPSSPERSPVSRPTPKIWDAMPKKVKPTFPFGERLMKLRAERGLTQTQLAEMIGSNQPCISTYETVAEYPPTSVLVDMAKALKVSADELLGLKSGANKLQPADNPEERRLWKVFRKMLSLPERDRRAVIRLVNSLVGSQEE